MTKLREYLDAKLGADLEATITLTPPAVPVDCVWGAWSEWEPVGDWSPCINGLQSRTERRTRVVLTPAANGGAACEGPTEEVRPVTRECVPPPPLPGDEPAIEFRKIGDGAVRGHPFRGVAGQAVMLYLHGTATTAKDATGQPVEPTHPYGDLYEYFWPKVIDGQASFGGTPGYRGTFTVTEPSAGLVFVRPSEHIRHPVTGKLIPCWYTGIDEHGRAYRFVEQRLDAIMEFVLSKYQIDRKRVYCAGPSLGGRGTLTYGVVPHPWGKFAALNPIVPDWFHQSIGNLYEGDLVTRPPAVVLNPDGSDYFASINMLERILTDSREWPIVMWSIGRNDSTVDEWRDQILAASRLTEMRRAYVWSWNDGNHGGGADANHIMTTDYPVSRFRADQSHPAFFRSSIDHNPLIDLVGQHNIGFDWRNVIDTAERWSCEVTNKRATIDMTVEVAPYNCQVFRGSAPKLVTIPKGQWVGVEFTVLPGPVPEPDPGGDPDPEPEPGPNPTPDPQPVIHTVPVNHAAVLHFQAWHESSRYERHQEWHQLTRDVEPLRFGLIQFGAGTPLELPAGTYRFQELDDDGELVRTLNSIEVPAGTRAGVFEARPAEMTRGEHLYQINGPGGMVSVPMAFTVNPGGGPLPTPERVLAMSGSYEVSHRLADFHWAWIPNKPMRHVPLPLREFPPLDTSKITSPDLSHPDPVVRKKAGEAVFAAQTALRRNLVRTDLVPVTEGNIRRINQTRNGHRTTANWQAYAGLRDVLPKNHIVDGPRGVGTFSGPTHIFADRHGAAFITDSWGARRVNLAGTVRTRYGLRNIGGLPGYDDLALGNEYKKAVDAKRWESAADIRDEMMHVRRLEMVGDVSRIERFLRVPIEIWSMHFFADTLLLDPTAPPIGGEQPHAAGPVALIAASQSGAVYRLEFSPTSFEAEPVVTLFAGGLAFPFEALPLPTGDVLISERNANRISIHARDGTRKADWHTPIMPEGLYLVGDWVYYSTRAGKINGEIRRRNWKTDGGDELVVDNIRLDNIAEFIKFAVDGPDGGFSGIPGTSYHVTWSNSPTGFPVATLPGGVGWNWHGGNGSPIAGRGAPWRAVGYGSAVGVGPNRMFFGSSQEGLSMISGANMATDVPVDVRRYQAGEALFRVRGSDITHGYNGYGVPELPWGEHADMDYYLSVAGHARRAL